MEYEIKWQDGVVSENGINGLQIDDVLYETIRHLKEINTNYPCKENEITLSSLRTALQAQQLRTENRIKRGVEGKNIK